MPEFHAKISPSSFKQFRLCPASYGFAQQFKKEDDRGGPAAQRGTALHEAVELLLDFETVEAGDVMTNGHVITEDELIDVHMVSDWVVEQDFDQIWIEQKMPIGQALGLNDPDLMWGTSDITAIKNNNLYVVDAKFGFIDVSAEENDQAVCYTIGANFQFPSKNPKGYDRFFNVIIQPRAGGVKSWDYNQSALKNMTKTVHDTIRKMMHEDAEFVAGEDQCRFCDASGACQAQMDQMLGADFDDMDKLTAGALDNATIANLLERDAAIRKALDNVKSQALQRLSVGQTIKGWKRVAGNTRAKWNDEADVVEMIIAEGLDVDEFAPRKPVTQTALRKVLGDPTVEALVVRPPGSPALVKASDKRPSLDNEFDVIDE